MKEIKFTITQEVEVAAMVKESKSGKLKHNGKLFESEEDIKTDIAEFVQRQGVGTTVTLYGDFKRESEPTIDIIFEEE